MTIVKTVSAVALIGVVTLVSCTRDVAENRAREPVFAETDDIDAFVKNVLGGLQPASIEKSREYCGYVYETVGGGLATTPITRGGEDFCDLPEPDETTLASFHTHGGYSDSYDNEVPSVDDVTGDFEAGIDGYVATPGGRVWLIDHKAQIIRQLCAEPCITSDPDNDPEEAGFVPQSFTLPELRTWLE
ncbi:MAG: hypothetical protein ACJAZ1_000130 [Yoonia sp.]|jgi:hypothetical protein